MNFALLKNPFIFGIAVAIIMLLATYIDSKITKKKRTRAVYFKIFLASGIVSGVLQLFLNDFQLNPNTNTNTNVAKTQIKIKSIKKGTNIENANLTDIDMTDLTNSSIGSNKKVYTDMPDWS